MIIELETGKKLEIDGNPTPEQIDEVIAHAGQNTPSEAVGGIPEPSAIDTAGSAWEGWKQGVTAGFGDEIQGGAAALAAKALGAEEDFTDLYAQGRDMFREQKALAKEQSHAAYLIPEVLGSVATGASAATRLGGAGLAKAIQAAPIKTASGIGALSGALYGFGTGEGSPTEQARQAGISAGLGAVVAPLGAAIAPKVASLAGRARSLFSGGKSQAARVAPSVTQDRSLQEIIQQGQDDIAPAASTYAQAASDSKAMQKVVDAVKKDFPENYEQVLAAWKRSDVPLAQLYGKNTTNLAKGAAQYPSGQPVTERYFEKEVADAPERIGKALSKNISSVENYYATADDLLKEGMAKAKPLYQKAFEKKGIASERVAQFLSQPELKAGLKQGLDLERIEAVAQNKQFNPMDYAISSFDEAGDPIIGQVPNMRLLDAAKRGLDAMIKAETDVAGKVSSKGRSLLMMKDAYLKELDALSPDYKAARDAAGDYFKIDQAIKSGKDFMKQDSENIGKMMKAFSPSEKDAYKIGVGKQMRDLIEKSGEGFNTFQKTFGSSEQKKRLMKILSPQEYKNLETSLRAENRLFRMRNEVLGGSPTVSKAMAAANLAAGGAEAIGNIATGGVKAAGLGAIRQAISKAFDGLNDRTAEHVAKIIYETDPVKKLQLIERVAGDKALTNLEKRAVKEAYFQTAKILSPRAGGAAGAAVALSPDNGSGVTPEMIKNSYRTTVTTPRGKE